jgi:hypothetical protein
MFDLLVTGGRLMQDGIESIPRASPGWTTAIVPPSEVLGNGSRIPFGVIRVICVSDILAGFANDLGRFDYRPVNPTDTF